MRGKDKILIRKQYADELKREFRGVTLFLFSISGIINVLALTGSFYMLQIYDRVLASGSVPTLLAISTLAMGLYFFQGMFDVIRGQVLVRVGARFDRKFAPAAHQVAIDMPRFGYSTSESLERGRDVDTVRSFLGSQGPMALFDLPWMPLYLVFVYMLHPMLGALTIGGAFVLTILTVVTELRSRQIARATQQSAITRNAIADSNARNADILRAMGFSSRAVARFVVANDEHLKLQTQANDITGTLSAVSRVLRMLLQSALLGLGAYLVIQGSMSAGSIIACSVAASRALAPIDLAISNWKNVVGARNAFRRIQDAMVSLSDMPQPMLLPTPKSSLKIEKITVAAPSSGKVLLSEVGFELHAGQGLGIIGPSAGGKTSLIRAITGVWPSLRGSVRLDDADLSQYSEEMLGKNIGYLPQEVALLDATIEENISRFAQEPDPAAIVAAAEAAGVHEMIVRLDDGYRTQIGPQGAVLSAGQRQRIGLARALYGNPFLVVLDEPNSNLDGEGEAALSVAIKGVRERGGIVVVVAHRPSALANIDLVAVVQNGRITNFGDKATVLAPVKVEPERQNATPRMPSVTQLKPLTASW